MEHNRPDLDALRGNPAEYKARLLRGDIPHAAALNALSCIVTRAREIDDAMHDSSGSALPPTGDDYNLLFDAIFDEIDAIIPAPGG